MYELTLSDKAILTLLLDSSETAHEFVDSKRFRVDNFHAIAVIDELVRRRLIIDERERYRVSLTAIFQLDTDIARDLMQRAELMWAAYREQYQTHLEKPLSLRQVADKCGIEIEEARRTLTYMLEVPWYGGYTSAADRLYESVSATEKVLRHEKFSGCVAELQSWVDKPIQLDASGSLSRFYQREDDRLPVGSRAIVVPLPDWVPRIPVLAQRIVKEIYEARSANLQVLTAMGIRSVIDVVSLDVLKEDAGPFVSKLNKLLDAGHLTVAQHNVLSEVVAAGSAAAHRGYIPDSETVAIMLDALNHMLQSIYVLEASARHLAEKTPPRRK